MFVMLAADVAASTGSACHAASGVLGAMGGKY